MGDPKKAKKTYTTPRHPWQKARIVEEQEIVREYALKNKKEVYKASSVIKNMINHYKVMNTSSTAQSEKEKADLLAKAVRYGFLKEGEDVSHLLNLKARDVLERRLQSVVVKKKLARTMKQARQFIVHQHIAINGIVVDSPSYIVAAKEESKITFVARSSLVDENHPERAIEANKIKEELAATKAKKATSKVEDATAVTEDAEVVGESE